MTRNTVYIIFLSIAFLASTGDLFAQEQTSPQAKVATIINASNLSNAQKVAQVSSLITATGKAGGNVVAVAETALTQTPPGLMDAMIAGVVTSAALQDPSVAPQVIAAVVNGVDAGTAAKVVAAISVLAPTLPINPAAVTSAIQSMVSDPAKVAAVTAAAANPASVVDAATVRSSSTETLSVITASTTPVTSSSSPVQFTIPAIPVDVVGYGGQTEPAP
ncbi:hypothetical protein P4E94_18035 [Pontiellaceae bacterium B12219]|nr:hypothetical protein [Pontiellaceae bacterium B12219]